MRDFVLPGTRARHAPDRTCAVRHYRLDLDVDLEARRIAGTATLTLEVVASEAGRLRLDAVELDVAGVRRDGGSVEFTNDGKNLWIELGATEVGQRLDVEVTYAATPRRGLYFVGPDEGYPDKPLQVWSQGQDEDSRYWFPCLDTPSEKATSEVIATVPADFVVLSNGQQQRDQLDGARRTFHWRFDVPHSCYLITLAAGRLVELTERAGGVEVAYYCAPGREEDCRRTLGRTPAMLDLFARRFGVPYPYARYAQVFVADFIFGGMENTTATTLTDTVLFDERASLDFDADFLVAHELAHQWFGDLLTCRTWGEGWLNEGFATYSEYVWREAAEGRDEADLELEEWAAAYLREDASRYRRVIATNVYDEPIDIFDHHLYEKGGRVLHMLRDELGDPGFWRTIKHYLEKHRTGSVETRDLARAVEEATGRNLDWFFEQWVTRGAGHPELELAYAWDGDKRLASITVKQTQKVEGATPLFRLSVEVELEVSGVRTTHRFTTSEAQHAFHVPCPVEPTLVVVDPGKRILAATKSEKSAPLWIADLARASLAIDRRDAAAQLGRIGGRPALDALTTALQSDPVWSVRAAAADALGGLRTVAARAALLAALEAERHPKARRAIVRALGGFRGDEIVADALIPLVERGEASYFVEAEACLALARTRSPRAFDVVAAAGARPSFTEVIRQHVHRGLAELRDERALPLLEAATRYGEPPSSRRAAIMALSDLARGRRDRSARDVRERAEELLRDPDFRVQSAAIEALAALGDPAAAGALGDLIGRELDGRLRRRAREVVRDLAEGRGQSEQVTALRDEVDRLKTDAARLRERLDVLEATTGTLPPSPGAGPRGAGSTAAAPRAAASRTGRSTAKTTATRSTTKASGSKAGRARPPAARRKPRPSKR